MRRGSQRNIPASRIAALRPDRRVSRKTIVPSTGSIPRTLEALRRVGPRPHALQIVPPRQIVRPTYLRTEDKDDHELVTRPLASPTGPGGAQGFRNRAGSQIATPQTTNVYLGDFWGDRPFFEEFSRAI